MSRLHTRATVQDLPRLGKRIRRQREKINLSPSEVAQRVGISLGNFSNVEDGRCLPSLPRYKRICRVLGVSAGPLLRP